MNEEQKSGVVKFFNSERGFGFIIDDDGGREYFVHHSAIVSEGFRTLDEGDKVQFHTEEGTRGPVAKKVTKV